MNRLLAWLERKLGRHTGPGLTVALVLAQALVFALSLANRDFTRVLVLDHRKVLAGEVWRLFSYLFIPPLASPIFMVFALYWVYQFGTAVETTWGPVKYQAYWLVGALFTTASAFLTGVPATNAFLLMSLFLAFATLFPDYQIMIFFVLPVKVKWLALLDALLLASAMWSASGFAKLLPLVAVGNYLLFFLPTLRQQIQTGALRAQRSAAPKYSASAREEVVRKCNLCGITSADDPDLQFRICACEKCGGKATEYCIDHARNH